jgi:hypothetical protein
MRTSGDVGAKEDTTTTSYAGGIAIFAILVLVGIRAGMIKVGK